jgi:hypothetical protein
MTRCNVKVANKSFENTGDLGYSVTKGTECFVVTEKCNVKANSEELIGNTEYMML